MKRTILIRAAKTLFYWRRRGDVISVQIDGLDPNDHTWWSRHGIAAGLP